ncbi:hypothetical protein M0804_013486 [Polistes exclamans]|nr:hypothetical protein M0804_013486 [Polistes exclamans]
MVHSLAAGIFADHALNPADADLSNMIWSPTPITQAFPFHRTRASRCNISPGKTTVTLQRLLLSYRAFLIIVAFSTRFIPTSQTVFILCSLETFASETVFLSALATRSTLTAAFSPLILQIKAPKAAFLSFYPGCSVSVAPSVSRAETTSSSDQPPPQTYSQKLVKPRSKHTGQ